MLKTGIVVEILFIVHDMGRNESDVDVCFAVAETGGSKSKNCANVPSTLADAFPIFSSSLTPCSLKSTW